MGTTKRVRWVPVGDHHETCSVGEYLLFHFGRPVRVVVKQVIGHLFQAVVFSLRGGTYNSDIWDQLDELRQSMTLYRRLRVGWEEEGGAQVGGAGETRSKG